MEREQITTELGAMIKAARERKGWTVYELAKRTGLQASHLAKIEEGVYSVRVDILDKVCRALGMCIEFPL